MACCLWLLSVITVMYIQVEKSNCEKDGDPSMEFQLNSSAHIHACLQLPAVIAGNLPNMPPLTAKRCWTFYLQCFILTCKQVLHLSSPTCGMRITGGMGNQIALKNHSLKDSEKRYHILLAKQSLLLRAS